jgi:hypothetical protein
MYVFLSRRLDFNSGAFKQEDSYLLRYYAMLPAKCLPNSHSARRNSPEGWLHQHRWENLTRGSEGIVPKHAIRKVSLNVQNSHSINLSADCMMKPREWFRKKSRYSYISVCYGGPGRLFRVYKNPNTRPCVLLLLSSGFAPRSEKVFFPTFRYNMLLPLPGWQNFIPVDGEIFILHLAQFQSSSQTLDETNFTKEFNTRRPSFEQNPLWKPENSFFNTVIFHDFRVTILAQFHIRSTTTPRLLATVYYIKSQPPSRVANIVSSRKLGKNRAVSRGQISLVK